MNSQNQTKSALVIGFLVAVPTNAALIFGLSASSAAIVSNTTNADEAHVERPEEQRLVELGDTSSRAISLNWIGYERPAPMNAPEADVEQTASELTPPKGDDGQGAPAATGSPAKPISPGAVRLAAAAREVMRESLLALLAIRAGIEPVVADVADPDTSPEHVAAESDAPSGPDLASVGAPAGQADSPAPVDTRESDAFTINQVLDASLGSPVVNQGLRIDTVRPEWTLATLMTQRPRNPIVSIAFDARGRVADAVFLDGKDTGIAAVDQPLLDAVYRWTAKGDLIDRLARERPGGVVWVQIRVMLRRE